MIAFCYASLHLYEALDKSMEFPLHYKNHAFINHIYLVMFIGWNYGNMQKFLFTSRNYDKKSNFWLKKSYDIEIMTF